MRMTRLLQRLARSRRGAAVVETALLLPTVLFVGLGGIELTNLALSNLRVSQIAAQLADNASRVSADAALPLPVIREQDVNELFASALSKGEKINLEQRGRIILSSLETEGPANQQIIRWQRCVGKKKIDSSYGKQGQTGSAFTGMGPAGEQVSAPPGGAVMFVEIAVDYEPIVMGQWLGPRTIKFHSSYIVRDDRELDQIYNPEPKATPLLC